MGLGVIVGYGAVIWFGSSSLALAICFGLVGFMLYGPDSFVLDATAGKTYVLKVGKRRFARVTFA